jgi:hypothetical protein
MGGKLMREIPFTDKALEAKGYADECDRLSTLEAQSNHTSWGRWFLEDGYLCTWVCVPSQSAPYKCEYKYDFMIELCRTSEQKETWVLHMQDKNWMGEQGIKDLRRAFKYLQNTKQ